ncbi:MAG: Hsp20/alpha crystallin family protein [Pirellulales bacterium]
MTQRVRGGFPQFREFRDEVDRLFSNLAAHPTVAGATRFVTGREFPSLNLWEDNDNVYAECELPGVRSEDLDISVVGSEMTIKGRRAETAEPQATYHRRERGVGLFSRTLKLPTEIAVDQVQASLREGVLLVTMPKAESAKPRKVQVRVSA